MFTNQTRGDMMNSVITNENRLGEYMVNVFDQTGRMIEQKRFSNFAEANEFVIQESQKGYDTHLRRLELLTE